MDCHTNVIGYNRGNDTKYLTPELLKKKEEDEKKNKTMTESASADEEKIEYFTE